MTREEAIKVLNMVEAHGIADEAKRMAIEALSAPQTDLISRADAIACLSHGEGCGHSCRNRINALPSAEAETKCVAQIKVDTEEVVRRIKEEYDITDGWIPCSERLPNTNGIYIVTRRRSDGFECRNLADACYFDGASTWHDDTRVNHGRKYLTDVLAWMPLPEPYREDGEEE